MRQKSNVSIIELAEKFKLDNTALCKKIKHLSHGNLQKIGIIQAFIHNPQLLILDEPTIGLDPLMQEIFYEVLLEYRKNGGTVFFSSHNLFEVEKVCDKIAIIKNGNLVAVEKLEDLKKKRFRKLTIQFKSPVKKIQLSNSKLLSKKENEYTFLIKGSIEVLLQELSHLPVKDFIFPKPDLEEVFMAYYSSEEKEKETGHK